MVALIFFFLDCYVGWGLRVTRFEHIMQFATCMSQGEKTVPLIDHKEKLSHIASGFYCNLRIVWSHHSQLHDIRVALLSAPFFEHVHDVHLVVRYFMKPCRYFCLQLEFANNHLFFYLSSWRAANGSQFAKMSATDWQYCPKTLRPQITKHESSTSHFHFHLHRRIWRRREWRLFGIINSRTLCIKWINTWKLFDMI